MNRCIDDLFRGEYGEDGLACITRNGKVLFYLCGGKDCMKQAAAGLNDEFNPGWKSLASNSGTEAVQ